MFKPDKQNEIKENFSVLFFDKVVRKAQKITMDEEGCVIWCSVE